MTRLDEYALHVASIAEAKEELVYVAPEQRGELARYVDLGEEQEDVEPHDTIQPGPPDFEQENAAQ